VRRRHDPIEARLMEREEHRDAFLFRGRTVVDARDPVAMQIDETAHGREP
jgi:hypothetical protein